MTSDEKEYCHLQEKQLKEWESLCKRCGACCGVYDQGGHCEHLIKSSLPHQYSCAIYDNRFGTHKTISGNNFSCVPLRNILHKTWPGDY